MTEQVAAETEARANGWVPKEEFRGDETRWKSAEDFNAAGKNIAAVQSERNKKLVADMESMKQSMADMQKGQFELIREARNEVKSKYEQKLEKLKTEQEKAFDDGDKEKFQAVNAKIENLEPPKEAPKKEVLPAPDPVFVDWLAKNDWYQTDPQLMGDADVIGERLAKSGMTGKPFLDEIEKQVKKLNPDKFESKQSPSKVEGGSSAGGGGGGKGKSYSDLPAEAKKACDRFVKEIGMKKEDYVKEYFQE